MDEARPLIPDVPANVPRVRANGFTRWLGRSVLRLGGWRVTGTIPDVSKLVLIVAPHSSNWDGLWGFAAKLAMGLEIRVLGKRQLFWWPLGPILHRLGVIPIDRSAAQGTVGQVVEMMVRADHLWFAVTPEGTRKQVAKWKTGFWKIAHAARVPILPAYFHYPDKTIGIGELFQASDDANDDIARLREWYRPWMGRNRGTT